MCDNILLELRSQSRGLISRTTEPKASSPCKSLSCYSGLAAPWRPLPLHVLLELRKASLDEVRALKAPPRPLVRLFQMVRLSFARSNARVSLKELEANVAVATLRRARAAVLAHK